MKVAIHQPHYFPWEGYLNKIESVDKFILMDEVQLTDSSNMYRHRLLALSGEEKFITIPFLKEDYKRKPYREIKINDSINWRERQLNFIKENYKHSLYYDEVMNIVYNVLKVPHVFLCDLVIGTIRALCDVFDIHTELVLQSDLQYPRDSKKNQLVLELCKSVNADFYLSGNGARKYMELEPFEDESIHVEFQQFSQSVYTQIHSNPVFIPGLSILDMLFSVGVEQSVQLFKRNCDVK